ncbi:hypothetical protein VHEMI04190 [[Torrubiella] hemipterigena]|uniref:Thioredoxin-like fold protein n=1 Tax=[Torrubiella] hemipterigena TaxID=1531966 RepID=A0A0A1TDK6_9HYPO|nr:hypothetical protein VHEMI04190 [[Torrubiella] hemipterigena]
MFRFRKTLDIVTVFHKASSPASVRVANLAKQISAGAQVTATQDPDVKHKVNRDPFELNITEDAPTADQVQTIIEYLGKGGAGKVVQGAKDDKDALKKFRENKDSFLRPVTVDWNSGKAVVGDNESEILKLLAEQQEQQ